MLSKSLSNNGGLSLRLGSLSVPLQLSVKVLLPNCPSPVGGIHISWRRTCHFECAFPEAIHYWWTSQAADGCETELLQVVTVTVLHFASLRSHLVRMTQVAPAPASAGRCWNKSQIHVVQACQWVYHSHLPFAGLPGIVEWLTSIVSLKDWISGKITNILRYYFIMK